MTPFEIAQLVLAGLLVPLGVVLWSMLQRAIKTGETARAELADHKLHAAETYITRAALDGAMGQVQKSIDAVFSKLDRIEDKLDRKQDKIWTQPNSNG